LDQPRKGPDIWVRGLGPLSRDSLDRRLAAGCRFVVYEYCISLLLVTLWRRTGVYCRRAGVAGVLPGLPYTLISLLLGWWGVPWGFIYTSLTIITNLSGGRDVTDEVRAWWPHGPSSPAAN